MLPYLRYVIIFLLTCASVFAHADTGDTTRDTASEPTSAVNLTLNAAESWSQRDRYLAYTAGALLFMDWHTTRTLAQTGWCHHACFETNPLLGRYPTTQALDLHFALAPLIFALADQLPQYRRDILTVTTIVEGIAVTNNIIRFGWSWQF
jgi:hypothetical protein